MKVKYSKNLDIRKWKLENGGCQFLQNFTEHTQDLDIRKYVTLKSESEKLLQLNLVYDTMINSEKNELKNLQKGASYFCRWETELTHFTYKSPNAM